MDSCKIISEEALIELVEGVDAAPLQHFALIGISVSNSFQKPGIAPEEMSWRKSLQHALVSSQMPGSTVLETEIPNEVVVFSALSSSTEAKQTAELISSRMTLMDSDLKPNVVAVLVDSLPSAEVGPVLDFLFSTFDRAIKSEASSVMVYRYSTEEENKRWCRMPG